MPNSVIHTLKQAREYVDRAYECAFPDEMANSRMLEDIDALIASLTADVDMLKTVADEISVDFKHTARAETLRIIAKRLMESYDEV